MPYFNFGVIVESAFEKYKDKEIKYFNFSIVATLYLDKPEDEFIPIVEK